MDFKTLSEKLRDELDTCSPSPITDSEFQFIQHELEKCHSDSVWNNIDFRIPGKVIVDVIGSSIYIDGITYDRKRSVIETDRPDTSYRLVFENDDYDKTAFEFLKERIPYRYYFDMVISLWASVVKTGGKFIYNKTDENDTIEFYADAKSYSIKVIRNFEMTTGTSVIKMRKVAEIHSI